MGPSPNNVLVAPIKFFTCSASLVLLPGQMSTRTNVHPDICPYPDKCQPDVWSTRPFGPGIISEHLFSQQFKHCLEMQVFRDFYYFGMLNLETNNYFTSKCCLNPNFRHELSTLKHTLSLPLKEVTTPSLSYH